MILCYLLLVLAAGSARSEPLTITLCDRVQVAGERLLLGEIAALSGAPEDTQLAAMDLGPAPLPGSERTLTLGYIKMRLRRWGLTEPQVQFAGAAQVTVSSASPAPPSPRSAPATAAPDQPQTRPPAVTVPRGTALCLVVSCGGVTVVATATTLEDATVGAVVKVRVDQTRHTVWALLESPTQASMTGQKEPL